MSEYIAHIRDHVGVKTDKFYKTTLFQGQNLMVGLNCLEPGQVQPVHDHPNQDKFYYVVEGSGRFTLGDEATEASQGQLIWARAGIPHGVENHGSARLTILVGMAPPP